MNAICLIVDRLQSGYLGAYGNTWVHTPHLDRLAAESFVFDQALVDSPRLGPLYRSLWHGWHAIRRRDPEPDRPALADLLGEAGVYNALLCDEAEVIRHGLAESFDEVTPIDPPFEPCVAASIDQTHLARGFAQMIDWLEGAPRPHLLWCHLSGLGGPWDAPIDLRESFRLEGDPPPYSGHEAPSRRLEAEFDPDELLAYCHAYAGQVAVLDTCVGALLEFLHESPLGAETLLVLMGARGFPLGEHGRVGPCDEPLHGEVVHVPLMMRLPDGQGATARTAALVEPSDLWSTLLAWWRVAPPEAPTARDLLPLVREEVDALRDRLLLIDEGFQQAIRTPAWYLRASGSIEDGSEIKLYVKPDDRWEVNNVADRCHDVVDKLRRAFETAGQALQAGRATDLAPLDELLLAGLE